MLSKNGDPQGKCPVCEAREAESYKPFCSKRCADVDLNRWLTGNYAIPASDDDSDGAFDPADLSHK